MTVTTGHQTSKRNWLILAHCFNMDGRAASQTITDRLPGLMAKGVTPIVMSAPHGKKDRRFPHFQIFSIAPSGFLFEARHIINSQITSSFGRQTVKALVTLLLLPFYILEKLCIHLDSQWSWFLGAFIRGIFIIRKYKPSMIYSTAGPPSTHVAAFLLSKVFRLPWLAEIHDPLIYDQEATKWQNYYFKKWLEKCISKNASAVVYFTENALKSANNRHPFKGLKYIIRPGANPPDFTDGTYQKQQRIHFGHFGSLAQGRHLGEVIKALYQVLQDNSGWQKKICLDVYGTDLDLQSERYLKQYPLKSSIKVHGRLEYDSASGKSGRQRVLEVMRTTDVLLLIHGEGQECDEYIPSKLYEYLLTQRPILAIVSNGSELETVITNLNHTVVPLNDEKSLKEATLGFIQQWMCDELPDHFQLSPFTVDAAINTLLEIELNIT